VWSATREFQLMAQPPGVEPGERWGAMAMTGVVTSPLQAILRPHPQGRHSMIRRNPSGDLPVVPPSAFIDPTAIICGKVVIGENVFIGPYAVIRADETNAAGAMEAITIGSNSNIQDGVVIHSKAGGRVTIGEYTSIAHRAIVHGPCELGDRVFLGFNSVVFNCTIGSGSVVRHNSVVENCNVPPNFHIPSTSNIHNDEELAKVPLVSPDISSFSESVAFTNLELVRGYKRIQNEF
jgi:carbonic anhydrase/acetyltransferase-like protein (isoleucine patch superfamily)